MNMTREKSLKIFVTGTDTGAGKTIFTLALFLFLSKELGKSATVIKPIETGCDPECEDFSLYRKFLGAERVKLFYKFKYPAAPWRAAVKEGKEVDYEQLLMQLDKINSDISIIEGAGGLLVPITGDKTYLDLIRDLNLPVIVVAANKLGVINHTLVTAEILHRENVKGIIVLNDLDKKTDSFLMKDNFYTLRKFAPYPVIGRFPFIETLEKRELIQGIQPFSRSLLEFLSHTPL